MQLLKFICGLRLYSLCLVLATGMLVLPTFNSAIAQQYPSRPIIAIVPHAPGGGVDIAARIVVEKMKEVLGQAIVIENVPAAAGTVGVGRLAKSPPDGYTIAFGDQTSFVISSISYNSSYNVLTDFEPIALLTTSAGILVGRTSLPPGSARDLIGWVKGNPDGATIATFGRGSGPFIAAIALQELTGIKLRAVTYQGVAAGLQDLISGQVDLGITEVAGSLPHIRSGAIKPYGVLAKVRAAAALDLPTIEEGGGPPLRVITWRGLWAPKGTRADVLERLNKSVVATLSDTGVQSRIVAAGQEIAPQSMQSSKGLAAYHKEAFDTLAPLVKAAAAGEP